MSHQIDWIHPRIIRKWREQPPIDEAGVQLRQSEQRGRRRWTEVMAGATGLAPVYAKRGPTLADELDNALSERKN